MGTRARPAAQPADYPGADRVVYRLPSGAREQDAGLAGGVAELDEESLLVVKAAPGRGSVTRVDGGWRYHDGRTAPTLDALRTLVRGAA